MGTAEPRRGAYDRLQCDDTQKQRSHSRQQKMESIRDCDHGRSYAKGNDRPERDDAPQAVEVRDAHQEKSRRMRR